MLKAVVIVLIASCLIACAGPNANPDGARIHMTEGVFALMESEPDITLGDPRIYCDHRKKVGTNLPMRTCMLAEERELARERSLRETVGDDHIDSGLFDSTGGAQPRTDRR